MRRVRKKLYESVFDIVSKLVAASESGDAVVERAEL